MTKNEFLSILRDSLAGNVPSDVINENISYYRDYIENNDKAESQVLEELGDPRLIARTLIDTDDGTEVYDESGYAEESYGSDDYAENSTGNTTGRTKSYRLDLGTWYGKAIVIAIAVIIVILLATVLVAVAPFVITFCIVLYLISWFKKRRA